MSDDNSAIITRAQRAAWYARLVEGPASGEELTTASGELAGIPCSREGLDETWITPDNCGRYLLATEELYGGNPCYVTCDTLDAFRDALAGACLEAASTCIAATLDLETGAEVDYAIRIVFPELDS